MRLDVAAVTEAGPFRGNNEDAVSASAATGVFVVSDGVGGRPLGERAAALAVELFPALLRHAPSPDALRAAFGGVNDAICAESVRRSLSDPMAAVVTVAWLGDAGGETRGFVANTGNVRAFLFDRDGAGCQITRDHNALDADAWPESETLASPGRNVIARALGLSAWTEADRATSVDVHQVALAPGQVLALLSDGVTDYVDRARIAAIVAEHGGSATQLAEALHAAAIEAQQAAGRGDNVALLVVRKPDPIPSRLARSAVLRTAAALAAGAVIGLAIARLPIHVRTPPAPAAIQIAPSNEVTLAGVDASGDGPLIIHLAADARLVLLDSTLRFSAGEARIVLADRARLELVRTVLDAGRLAIEAAPGATLHAEGSEVIVREGENPFAAERRPDLSARATWGGTR